MEALEQKKKEIMEKAKQDIMEAERESILAEAYKELPPKYIHTSHRLYGVDASCSWESFGIEKAFTIADAVKISSLYPHADRMLTQGTFTSIKERQWYNSLPESHKDKKDVKEELEISPLVIKVNGFDNSLSFLFLQRVDGIGIVECRIKLNFCQYMRIDLKRVEFRGGYRIADSRLFADVNTFYTMYNADGKPFAEKTKAIKWARGSDQYPNDFTVLYCNLNSSTEATPQMMLESIQREIGKDVIMQHFG